MIEQASSGGLAVQAKGMIIMTAFGDECLDGPESCAGETFPRAALSGSGEYYPRCEHHYGLYVERLQPKLDEINRRYPAMAPSDFDPTYCGETWSEEDYY